MSTKIYSDESGREIVQYASASGPKLEIWGNPIHMSPEEAWKFALVLFDWAIENGWRDDYERNPRPFKGSP